MSSGDESVILVIDDTPDTLSMLSSALNEEGYRVIIATSGEKALQRAATVSPDLILLDILMPGMDGYEICRRLKADRRTRSIPVIFLSALAETFDKIRAFELGAVDYISKPIATEELLARIRTHLSIKQLEQRLIEANLTLEERVEARTAELSRTNIALQDEIAERTRIQAELVQSEGRIHALLDAIPDTIILLSEDGRIIEYLPTSDESSFIQGEKIAGKTLQESGVPKALSERILSIIRLANMNRTPQVLEFELQYNSGLRFFEARFVTLNNTRALGLVRNITEQKRIGNALTQATNKLSFLNAITFSDIQNDIFILAGYASLIQDMLEGEEQTHLKKMIECARSIQMWLEFTNNYQGLGLKPAKWYNIEHTFLLAISHLDMSLIRHEITLDSLEIFADPLLEKAFYNIIENTLLHGGGASCISLSYRRGMDNTILVIEDNGVGIPDEKKETIFERDDHHKTRMGLFLAKEILSITGIGIRERGSYGSGARFELTIPADACRFGPAPPESGDS